MEIVDDSAMSDSNFGVESIGSDELWPWNPTLRETILENRRTSPDGLLFIDRLLELAQINGKSTLESDRSDFFDVSPFLRAQNLSTHRPTRWTFEI